MLRDKVLKPLLSLWERGGWGRMGKFRRKFFRFKIFLTEFLSLLSPTPFLPFQRKGRKGAFGFLALILAPSPALAEISPERAAALERLTLQDCGSCHGLTRKGGLGPPLTAEALSAAEPEGLASIILNGVPKTAMPPWRPLLTEEEALWIARYLKSEKPR